MKGTYKTPVLHRLGGVAELTGTGGDWDDFCLHGKTFGLPSDINFTIWGHPIPITECETGS